MAPPTLDAGIYMLRRQDRRKADPHFSPRFSDDLFERALEMKQANDEILLDPSAHIEYDIEEFMRRKEADLLALIELARQAIYDPLTGMLNRRGYDIQGPQLMDVTRRLEGHLLYVLADIDRFKQVNDTYGHSTADKVLKSLGDASAKTLRGGDLACRIGGDEFAFLLPAATTPGKDVITRLDRKYHEILSKEQLPDVSISYGYATYDEDVLALPDHQRMPAGPLLETLKEIADSRMYRSKRSVA